VYPASPPPDNHFTTHLHTSLPPGAADSQGLDGVASKKKKKKKKKKKNPPPHDGPAQTGTLSATHSIPQGTIPNPVEILSSPETRTKGEVQKKTNPKETKPKAQIKRLKTSTKLTKYEKRDIAYRMTGDGSSYLPLSAYAHSNEDVIKAIRDAERYGLDYLSKSRSSKEPLRERPAHLEHATFAPVPTMNGGSSVSSSRQPIAQPTAQPVAPPPDVRQDTYVCETAPTLVPEQQQVVDLILEGHNVFYTGSAGCGKSTVLKAFVSQLRRKGRNVQILAPTNLAALNVGGQTTWSFAGWTPDSMKKPLDKLMNNAFGNKTHERFTKVDVVIIDEISMIENLQFERLNAVMKHARDAKNTGKGAFGGAQIVVTGDVSSTFLTLSHILTSPVLPAVTGEAIYSLHWMWLGADKRQQMEASNTSLREPTLP
jgi:hypothetical protein